MIKEYGNVRKRTKESTGRTPHTKVYRDGVKTSKRYNFFNAGYYMPAFLYIQLNENIDFQDFENHSDEVKGAFMHVVPELFLSNKKFRETLSR